MTPVFDWDGVRLFHGDALELPVWDVADGVMVTDPPYGRDWRQGRLSARRHADDSHEGIVGDATTATRDAVLERWGDRPAIVFGSPMLAPPARTKHVLVYVKATNAGVRGAVAGFRRDVEVIYLVGDWGSGIGGRSSVLTTREPSQGNPYSPAGRWHHPHAKPTDVMLELVGLCSPLATVVDPFAGSGSTLVAARRLRRGAVGVEIDGRYCDMARRRLSQGVLELEGV